MTAVTGESGEGNPEEEGKSIAQGEAPVQPSVAEVAQAPEAGVTPQAPPRAKGRRAQLRIVRETIQSLSNDLGSFRKSHEASVKRLEAQVTSLRKELAVHAHSKDLGIHVKSHEAGTKRLEKEIASLRSDMASLKGQIAREAAKSRAMEEAALSRVLTKVSAKPSSKKPPAKGTRKKR